MPPEHSLLNEVPVAQLTGYMSRRPQWCFSMANAFSVASLSRYLTDERENSAQVS